MFSRRHFISLMSTLLGTANAFAHRDRRIIVSDKQLENPVISRKILPPALKKGATVGIVAPASGVDQSDIASNIAIFKALGLKVELASALSKSNRYLAAPDNVRASQFMEFVERRDIDAILCARGGYGVMRILPMLDFDAIRRNPKIIMGYSDITALLIAIEQISGLITFHGPVASSHFDPFTTECFLKTVFASTEEKTKPKVLAVTDDSLITLCNGVAIGRLVGGNLSMVVSTLGTPYEIDTAGAILFLEEVSEEPYKIDRMLTQLWLAGKLHQCAGIALGQFKNCEATKRSDIELSFTLRQVLAQRISTLNIPAAYGLPFGHVKSKMTLPIGIQAKLDATKKSLTILETSVTA